MKKFLLNLLFLAVVTPLAAQTLILPGDYADPTILKDGDDYYMTHSPFYYQPGFLIWHSRDLFNWEPVSRAGEEWSGSAWAPDLQKVGDTYYIYFPADDTNWVMTAKDIRGPWTKPADTGIKGIDPGLAVTPDGKRYLFTSAGYVTPLTDDGLRRSGETRKVYDGWAYPHEWETECMCLESPKITYHNGYYYMTSAEGGTAGPATSHMAVCARAKDIYGPWENSPYNPVVHTYSDVEKWWSKGHGSLVEGPDGQWWIVYHAYEKGAYFLGRQTLMEPVEWTEGGWYRPVKDLDIKVVPERKASLSDDFDGDGLGWQWTGWKEDITRSVFVKKGRAIVPARGAVPHEGRLMLITATDSEYSVETEVTIKDKGLKAGLVLFYNEHAYAGLLCDSKAFTVYKTPEAVEEIPNDIGRSVFVRMDFRKGLLDISVSADGDDWSLLCADVDVSEFHHNRFGAFLALRPALCSLGSGQAEFHHFVYSSDGLAR